MDYQKLNELKTIVHRNAVAHGFWDSDYSDNHYLMFVVCEVAEIVEADRKGCYADIDRYNATEQDSKSFEKYIKNTLEDEMADVVIRLLDLAETKKGWITFYDISWSYEKYSITTNAFVLTTLLTNKSLYQSVSNTISKAISFVDEWAKSLNIDLEYFIDQKMRYNATRPLKHRKKY